MTGFGDKPNMQEDYSKRPVFLVKAYEERWNMVRYSFKAYPYFLTLWNKGLYKDEKITS